jgi:hypothetical protein
MDSICERAFEELQDIEVPNLDTAEQFVVGVARCWDAFLGHPDTTMAWRELAPVFVYMNVVGALCAFDSVFRILQRHRLRSLRFGEVDSMKLGLAEARVLCSLAGLQRGNARLASAALTGALSRTGVHELLPPLARIAATLDVSGHRLPAWRDLPTADARGHARSIRSVRPECAAVQGLNVF